MLWVLCQQDLCLPLCLFTNWVTWCPLLTLTKQNLFTMTGLLFIIVPLAGKTIKLFFCVKYFVFLTYILYTQSIVDFSQNTTVPWSLRFFWSLAVSHLEYFVITALSHVAFINRHSETCMTTASPYITFRTFFVFCMDEPYNDTRD